MDRTVDTTSTEKGFVRRVHDGVDVERRDVPASYRWQSHDFEKTILTQLA